MLASLWIILLLTGCGAFDLKTHDTSIGRTEEDFQSLVTVPNVPMNREDSMELTSENEEAWPDIFSKKVSLDLDITMHVADVLEVLCKRMSVPYLIAPDIEGSLSYHVMDRPFQMVLEDICGMLDLVFSWEKGRLRVWQDSFVHKSYPLCFLSHSRNSQTHVSNRMDIMAGGGRESLEQSNIGYTLDTKSTQDFWGELEGALGMILKPPASFALQRNTGVLHVYAKESLQRKVQNLIKLTEQQMKAQVLIEARVVEVTLKETCRSGIDWAQFQTQAVGAKASFGSVLRSSPALMGSATQEGFLTLNFSHESAKTLLSFMESFGTVRTLSSPRITVLHNQNAFLKVAENQIFFDVKYERQFLSGDQKNYGSLVASHSRIQSIPIGLVLSVHPAINQRTGEVTLSLRPTISRIVGTREDPSVKMMADSLSHGGGTVHSEIPIVAVREMDSVLKLQSGHTVVLGGLMIEGSDQISTGLPGMRRGHVAFLSSAKRSSRMMTELVIFLRATIVRSPGIAKADQRLYREFSRDPRPLNLQGK